MAGYLGRTSQLGRYTGVTTEAAQNHAHAVVGSRGETDYNRSDAMQITVDVPAALSGQSTKDLAARARLLLVVDEVRAERLTRSAAARALGMTLDEFLIEAGPHGLLAVDYDVDDFRRELRAIPPADR